MRLHFALRVSSLCGLFLCSSGVWASEPATTGPASIEDIVQTRDIDAITPSPDGSSIAFRVLFPSLSANAITAQWYRITFAGDANPVSIGPRSTPMFVPGFDMAMDGKIHWAKNDRTAFILLERNGQRQVYSISSGQHFSQVTHDRADVEDFNISPDQRSLIIQVRNPVQFIRHAQQVERDTGVHFDKTVYAEGLPLTGNFRVGDRTTTVRRQPPPGVVDWGVEAFRGDLRTKVVLLRTPAGRADVPEQPSAVLDVLDPIKDDSLSAQLSWHEAGGSVQIVRDATTSPAGLTVAFHSSNDVTIVCEADICRRPISNVRAVSLLRETGEVVIVSEPNSSGRTGVYGWRPSDGRIRTIVPPVTTLSGGTMYGYGPCPAIGHSLLCVQAGATLPPRLVQIDLLNGYIIPRFIDHDA